MWIFRTEHHIRVGNSIKIYPLEPRENQELVLYERRKTMKAISKRKKLFLFSFVFMLVLIAHQSFTQTPQKQPTSLEKQYSENQDQSQQIRTLLGTVNSSIRENIEETRSLKKEVETFHNETMKFSGIVGGLKKDLEYFWIILPILILVLMGILGVGYATFNKISTLNLKVQFEGFTQIFNQNLEHQFEKFLGLLFEIFGGPKNRGKLKVKSPFPQEQKRFDGFPSDKDIKEEGKRILNNSD